MADFKKITDFLANLVTKKKNTDPTDPWAAYDNGIGTPPFNGSRDTQVGEYNDVPKTGYDFKPYQENNGLNIIGLDDPLPTNSGSSTDNIKSVFDLPEVQELRDGILKAQGTLNESAPKLQKAKVDGTEAVLAAILGSVNPYASGKTLEVPNQLAQQRADEANQGIINDFNQKQKAAQGQINTNTKLIDYALDRDAVSQRVEAQLKAKQMDVTVKKEIATLAQNTQLIKTLANLEGNGGITEPAVATIYMQMGYQPDEAHTIAANVIDSIQKNPSLQVKIKQEKLSFEKDKLDQSKVKEDWDNLQNPNATMAEKYQIVRRLQRLGEIDPMIDGLGFAQQMGAQSRLAEENIALKKVQEDKVQAETNYKEALTKFLPSNMASQIAARYANIDHLRNLDQTARQRLDLDQQKVIQSAKKDEYKNIFNSLQKEYSDIQKDNNSLRQSRKALETQLHKIKTINSNGQISALDPDDAERFEFLTEEIGRYDKSISDNKAKQSEIHNQAESTRSEMRGDGVELEQPQELRETELSNNKPVSAPMKKINALKETFQEAFPDGSMEQWAPKGGRNIEGTNTPSLHNQGLALDLRSKNLQELANWAIQQPGVKTVIYNKQAWSPSKGWHPYSKNPHLDHVHVDYGSGNTISSSSKQSAPKRKLETKKTSSKNTTNSLPSGWSFGNRQ
jgi:hypothetical protein